MMENITADLDQIDKTSFKADRLSIDSCVLLENRTDCKPDSNATIYDI